ncbi:MAG: AAA family ATPase [Leptospira sp.]|nr:AAA family ATPase [Leptospira sp.]
MYIFIIFIIVASICLSIYWKWEAKSIEEEIKALKSQLYRSPQDLRYAHLNDYFSEQRYLFIHADTIDEKVKNLDKDFLMDLVMDLVKIYELFVHESNREKQEFLYYILEGIFLDTGKHVFASSIESDSVSYYLEKRKKDRFRIRAKAPKDWEASFQLQSIKNYFPYPDVAYLLDVFFQKFAITVAQADNVYSPLDQKKLESFCRYLYAEREKVNQSLLGTSTSGGVSSGTENTRKATYTTYPDLQSALNELNQLIGLDDIKSRISSLVNFVKIQNLREERGLVTQKISLSMVFYGSPGTGKTTVARFLGEIFRHLGILQKGHLVETDREGLVAGFIGQTAIKTKEVIHSAMDGVLFIDEAYALSGKNTSPNDSGKEAINTVLKDMEDNRDRLIVIVAGYNDEMKEFIASNPGLESRFGYHLYFPDYSPSELLEILDKTLIQKNMYRLAEGVDKIIEKHFKKLLQGDSKNFGNARYCRNLFEFMIQAQANRIIKMSSPTKDDYVALTGEDFQEGLLRSSISRPGG